MAREHFQFLHNTLCLEPSCIQAAAAILSNLDTSYSPCEEFYKYACNGWIRKNRIPTGQNTWSILRKLGKDGDYFTKDVLENTSKLDDPPTRAVQLARTYYNSCLDESTINSRGFTPLFNSLVELFGGWVLLPPESPAARKDQGVGLTVDKFSLTQLYLPSFRLYGASPLCRITVGNDQRNSTRYVIDPISAYRKFMKNYTRMLGVPESSLSAMDDVYQFEKEISMRTEERGDRDPERNYELIKLSELPNYCSVIDWKWLLNELFKPLNYPIADDQWVAINDREFFRARCKLYEEYLKNDTGIRTLHNSAVWYFLWRTVFRMPVSVNRALEEYKEVELGECVIDEVAKAS
ncbi:unnamed protein product [Echinostoma caproni]|uniref:Peptidase_M13_N domain-containing protein n=1 Tax=Echinostoma caproni TaxID=27848 RepID=A0A183A899_9TREM|nr:unnamed protein product [Echinostoma caproni]